MSLLRATIFLKEAGVITRLPWHQSGHYDFSPIHKSLLPFRRNGDLIEEPKILLNFSSVFQLTCGLRLSTGT